MIYCKQVDESLIFDGDGELILYVPENYFDIGVAEVIGNTIEMIGICSYGVYDKNGKELEFGNIDFPSKFHTQPASLEKIKEHKLMKEQDPTDYRLLKYVKGNKVVVRSRVEKNIENVESVFKLFVISGNGPETIDYRDAYKIFIKSMAINEGSFNLSYQLFGVMVSELYRSKSNPEVPFRLSKEIKNNEWYNYKLVSVKDIPDYVSPFVSITSERFDDSTIKAMLMDEEDYKYSPLEKVFTGK